MNNVVWKAFKMNDLFIVDKSKHLPKNIKDYDTTNIKNENNIANVTASSHNNGIANYITCNDDTNALKQSNELTLSTNGSVGACFYHNYEFVMTSDVVLLIAKDDKLKNIIKTNKICGTYLANIITCLFTNSVFSWAYKINGEKFNREVILLPCIECSKEESIWEDKYTLAVEYIESLMERAKERREANTIKKYEAERKKYEADYFIEKNKVVWKSFKVGDLFTFDDTKRLSKPIKAYNTQNEPSDDYIPNVTASGKNNGIANYIQISEETNKLKQKDAFTLSGVAGSCFYHDYEFVMTSNVALLTANNDKLKNIIKLHKICSTYIANTITNAFTGVYSWAFGINSAKFNREIIMLPCVECNKEEAIWEDRYTLAVNYIKQLMISAKDRKYEFLCNSLYNKRCEA